MSNRDELLDEAIVKAKEAEDWQLAEWLRTARGADASARWYTAKINGLTAENAKLRKLVRMMLRVAGVAEYATDSEWQVVTDYLRELGIEVGG